VGTSPRRRAAEVESLLQDLDRLSAQDTAVLAELWADEDEAGRRRAWQRAKAAIERSGGAELLDRARLEVGRWMLAGQSDYQGIGGLLGRQSDEASLRRLAAPALLDAVAGLLAEPDMQADDADVLLRPWRLLREAEPTG